MLKLLAAGVSLLAASGLGGAAQSQKADSIDPQTVVYCEILKDPQAFNGKMIRVRALYQTDFEQSVIAAPGCTGPFGVATLWSPLVAASAWSARSSCS